MATESERQRFESVVAVVYDPLQRYLRRRLSFADAEDALAETLTVMWRRIDDIPVPASLPWCYGVARNVVANMRRSEARRIRLADRLAGQGGPHSHEPADDSLDPELETALASLRATDRELLRLWAWEDLEPREIAMVLGVSSNVVSLRLGRAKKKLAIQLERQSHVPVGHKDNEDTVERRS